MLTGLRSCAQLLDYDAARTRLRKLTEKAQEDPVKVPRAEKEEEEAREIFELLDSQLRNDLPLILELRVPYLDPSFECMVSTRAPTWIGLPPATDVFIQLLQVRMQTHFATDGYEKLGGVQRYFAEGVREEYAAGGLDAQVSMGTPS